MDNYTKFVLTVIALSLAAIAVKMPLQSASAQLGASCGSIVEPCYVRVQEIVLPSRNKQ